MGKENLKQNVRIFSWALYDLGNQFFLLNIISLYFVRWLLIEKQVSEIFYSLSFGASVFFVAIFAPFLGFIADASRSHAFFLRLFTLISIGFIVMLSFSFSVGLALTAFALANFFYQLAVVFYNALLVRIAPAKKFGLISGLGRMFAYIGAIISLYFMKQIVEEGGYRASFLPTALLFFVFALPALIFISDEREKRALSRFFSGHTYKGVLKSFVSAFKSLASLPGAVNFLKASFFALCAVNVVILFMSVYATKVFNLTETQLVNFLLTGTVFAVLGSVVSGFLSDYLGYRSSLIWIFVLWIISFSFGAAANAGFFFFLLAGLVGFTIGATGVVARALAISIVPKDRIGELFGLFNFLGYFSSIIGALFWALVRQALAGTGTLSYRIALFSLNIFIVFAIYFLLKIPPERKAR